ncbi:MAG TPA: amidohydrolase family protein [Gaiellaceae bacterium]|nr:amidohydrolase family protein [Gaiellaceae bacterium]
MTSRHTLEGLVVDPLDGAFPGLLVLEDGRIAEVERRPGGAEDPLLFPGFVDLHVYAPDRLAGAGVTGYLLATRELREPEDPLCLGLHLEGPFLNPNAAGAIPVDELTPVDLAAVEEWTSTRGLVRLVTLAPELPRALEAIRRLAAAGVVPALGHTRANALTVRAALDAGARFATHLWNAMAPFRARTTGPVPALLLDPRVTIGLIADGRHLHPDTEELTVRVAGPGRIALTSDIVAAPGHRRDGTLLGGDRGGAALVRRMARFGLAEAATMASLVPARLLGLADRGRLAPGYRADVAVLERGLRAVETLVAGEPLPLRPAAESGGTRRSSPPRR